MQTRNVVLAIALAVVLLATAAAQEEPDKSSILGKLLGEVVVRLKNMKRWLHDELHQSLETSPDDGRWVVIVKMLADEDADGRLSTQELSAFLAKIDENVTAESLAQYDLDGDGYLDDKEVVKAIKAVYA